MAQVLARLLGEDKNDTAEFVLALEKLSGHPGIDVRLVLEIEQKAVEQVAQLGLDKDDTPAEELYSTLLAKFEQDNDRFTRLIGGRSGHSHAELTPRIMSNLNRLNLPRGCWAVRRATLKEILLNNPPKKLMRHLGYRTADSLIKREAVEEIMAMAVYTEPKTFKQNLLKSYGHLNPSNFEKRSISLVQLRPEVWERLPRRGGLVGYEVLSGTVAVWPAAAQRPNGLALAVMILKAYQGLRTSSSWLEFNQIQPNYGQIVSQIADGNAEPGLQLANQVLGWRSLVNHFGSATRQTWPDILSERLNLDDLKPVELDVLTSIDSDLAWWKGLDFVAKSGEYNPTSFNLADVSLNFANDNSVKDSSFAWLSKSVKDELISRYLDNSWVEHSLMSELDDQLTQRVAS